MLRVHKDNFGQAVTKLAQDCRTEDRRAQYEEYADGYARGLKGDDDAAEREIAALATGQRNSYWFFNVPNNVLYGYLHGRYHRLHKHACEAAMAWAWKFKRYDHLPKRNRPAGDVTHKKSNVGIASEKRERWVKLSSFMEAAGLGV